MIRQFGLDHPYVPTAPVRVLGQACGQAGNAPPALRQPQASPSKPLTQELLALAEKSTKQANDVRARLRLIAAADELLRAGADFVIDQLIAEAASPRIARTLRRAFEYASERAVASRGLIDSHLVLFAIPMVATFAESIPETQWRTALDDDLISCFADGLPGCGTGSDRIVLAHGLFDFEQLSSLPLSLVRACATTTGSSLWGALPDDTVGEGAPLRRSTTFLCFAWGRRTRQLARGHANALQDSNRLALALANRLQRQLGPACRVQVGDPRPFHRSLREGLWIYQLQRLEQLAAAALLDSPAARPLWANLVARVAKHGVEIVVVFHADDRKMWTGRAFRPRTMPCEDLQACIARISQRLAQSGVRAVVLTPQACGRSGHVRAGARIEVPI